jgi:hypothetical protein
MLHGVNDPAYASHAAILVVNGNSPAPSDFAGKRVEATDALAQAVEADSASAS